MPQACKYSLWDESVGKGVSAYGMIWDTEHRDAAILVFSKEVCICEVSEHKLCHRNLVFVALNHHSDFLHHCPKRLPQEWVAVAVDLPQQSRHLFLIDNLLHLIYDSTF